MSGEWKGYKSTSLVVKLLPVTSYGLSAPNLPVYFLLWCWNRGLENYSWPWNDAEARIHDSLCSKKSKYNLWSAFCMHGSVSMYISSKYCSNILSTIESYSCITEPVQFKLTLFLRYSHAFRETNSLRRTIQIVECSLLHRWAQGRVSS